jgi:hypothetical protein
MFSSSFGVELATRQGQPLTVQTDLEFHPTRWKAAAHGGPQSCGITVTGSRAGLKALREWLRYGVAVYTPSGSLCWWGYVHEATVQLDGWAVTATLEGLRNRIAVTYSSLEGAIETAQTTAWADDLASQAEYGICEHLESIGQATASMATAYRDRLLTKRARPQYSRAFAQSREDSAVLRCRGWGDELALRYWQRSDGRLEHMPADTETQPIGWGISASNQVGFGDYALHDAAGRLQAIQAGMKVTVSGANVGGNSKTYTARDGTSEEVETYANNSIRFEPTDDIFDTNGGMGMVKSDRWLRVQGSAINSRWHWVGSAGADHTRTSAGVSGSVEAEAAGPTITLTQAQRLDVYEVATYEAPGTAAGVSVTLHGAQIAQRFQPPTTMKIDRIMVEAAKVGNPADNLEVRILAESGGGPGALIISGSLAASALTDSSTAVWVPLSGTVTLAGGTNYWFQVRRSGAVDGLNYFTVGMTPTAYGSSLMWTGAAWVSHLPGWFLRFRLWAVEDTGVMAETMLAARLQTLSLAGGFASGVNGYPTMDSQATVADELERLTKIGAAGGARVLADVGPDLVLRLSTQAAAVPGETLRLLAGEGKLRITDAAGSAWPGGLLPVGRWAELADMDSDLAGEGGLSPAFLDAVEYDAESDSWTVEFEGERSLLDMLKVQAG